MGSTLAQVLPLALGAAVSPVILLLQVATLGSKRRPVARALLVLLGCTTVVVTVVLVVVLGHHRTTTTTSATDRLISGWIKISLAIVLLGVAVRTALTPRASVDAEPPPDDGDGRVHPVRSVLLGVAAMLTNVTTLVLLIPAVRDAATASIPTVERIAVLVITVLLQQVMFNVVSPRVLSSSVGVHPLFVFAALLVGSRVAGFWGVFLALPIAGIGAIFLRYAYEIARGRRTRTEASSLIEAGERPAT